MVCYKYILRRICMVDINIDELVKYVNDKMRNGLSMTQIEKEMKVGKDSIRKKLNKNGYKFDNNKRQYIKIKENNNNEIPSVKKTKQEIIKSNDKTKSVPEEHFLTQEEINILKVIAKNYNKTNTEYKLEGEIKARSFKTYKSVVDKFVGYCKENKLCQKDCIAIALLDFMNK